MCVREKKGWPCVRMRRGGDACVERKNMNAEEGGVAEEEEEGDGLLGVCVG